MSFDYARIIASIPKMLTGIGITLELLFLSIVLGMILGVITLLMRLSRHWILVWLAKAYIYLFRGTPILVQIFVIYYGLPQFEFIRESFAWPILREPFGCSVVALTLNSAAYVSEILRGGVLGVDKGLHDAGRSLGLRSHHRHIFVTAPIAIRLAIPAYSNEVISLLKSTALASTVTLMDVTGVARTIVAKTFAPYEIFVAAAIIYLVITWLIQRGFGRLERRISRYVRQ